MNNYSRRRFCKNTAVSLFAVPTLSIPVTAHAWFWFGLALRTAAGFVGKTVGRSAARSLLNNSGRRAVSQAVKKKTKRHIRKMENNGYNRNDVIWSTNLAGYLGEKVGESTTTSIFDEIVKEKYSEDHEVIVSADQGNDDTADFSLVFEDPNHHTPTIHLPYLLALTSVATIFTKRQFPKAKCTSLLYPLSVQENNMIRGVWNNQRPTYFETGVGNISITPYIVESIVNVADIMVRDSHNDASYTYNQIPIGRRDVI